jgi:signal transduction histidine kinase/ActR/RegA family two-component response regulator
VGDQISNLGPQSLEELLSPPSNGTWHEIQHRHRTYETVAKPLTSTHNLTGWVVVLRNVTEERTIRHQLVQQERLAAVGRLAAGIAHDFNNIMAVIVLYAQIASRQLGLSPDLREKLDVIHQQAHRATELIEQILDFTRQTQLERQTMSLLPYLKEIIKLWQRTLPENIEIELVHNNGAYRIHADPTRIQQALMNLATNARDAMPRGGTIRIELTENEFTDRQELPQAEMSPGRWVQLDFSDTGEGMDGDVLSHAFEPFYTTKETGTGLGLPQVLGIVQQHGGAIDISSEVDEGTTVTIYIPAFTEPSMAGDPSVQSRSLIEGQQEQILVVEDNPETRMALVEALHAMNYRTIETATGREALDILDQHAAKIDLILSDAVMPEMGLAGLLEGLVARKVAIPVIVVSGYLQPAERERLRETGPLVAWLTKPVDLQTLARTIKMVLEGDA